MNTKKNNIHFKRQELIADSQHPIRKPLTEFLKAGFFISVFLMFFIPVSNAQNLDVPYVPTPSDVVEVMLDLADVGPGDYVIDLGSGDGRIVIAAAKRGAVGHGIDLNPTRVREARENAESEGVSDRVIFREADIFETDFSQASVITMYLLSSVNVKLRPYLLDKLSPGTRVVSHSFDMDEWQPDKAERYANRDIYYWVIPADVDGNWQWETAGQSFSMQINQTYQEVDITLRAGDLELTTEEATLSGKRLTLIAHDEISNTRYIFSGSVEDHSVRGYAQIHNEELNRIDRWSATLDEE
ncbi:MAG: methyltransferase domain-containing protein [Balneolaceae bacterium]|nr:methyltransferase domain-containing protein [Balneolaceae bacterium]